MRPFNAHTEHDSECHTRRSNWATLILNVKAKDLNEVYKTLKDENQILEDKCQILDHKSAPRSEHQRDEETILEQNIQS